MKFYLPKLFVRWKYPEAHQGKTDFTGRKTALAAMSAHFVYFGSASLVRGDAVREEASSLFCRCSSRHALLGCHLPP